VPTPSSDLLPAFNFVVQLIGSDGSTRTVAGFSECSGLESTLEVEEYQEGGVNDRVHKFPSRFTFSNITLTRGISVDHSLREWHQNLLRGQAERRDGLIIMMNEKREQVLAWKFEKGLPVKWTGPGLNATASETGTEALEIAHERLEPFDI
jgi:phage tail-like protein